MESGDCRRDEAVHEESDRRNHDADYIEIPERPEEIRRNREALAYAYGFFYLEERFQFRGESLMCEAAEIVRRLQALCDDLGDRITRDYVHALVVAVFSKWFRGVHWSPHKTARLVDSICSRLCIPDKQPSGTPEDQERWVSIGGLRMRRLEWSDDSDDAHLVPVEW